MPPRPCLASASRARRADAARNPPAHRPVPAAKAPEGAPFDHDLVVPGLAANQRAFNAGLTRHRGVNVLIFRLETTLHPQALDNRIAALALDASYQPQGAFSLLTTPHIPHTLHTAEDPRAFTHAGRLMVSFSLSDNGQVAGPRHMHLGEVSMRPADDGPAFAMLRSWRMIFAAPAIAVPPVEKNWAPFSLGETLCFSYRINPHVVVAVPHQIWRQPSQTTVYPTRLSPMSQVEFFWPAGECRGGTQAVFDARMDRYVTFFHSCHRDTHFRDAKGHPLLTYHFGCLTFRPEPPFDVDQVSPLPIPSAALVREMLRPDKDWGKQVVFVQGLVIEPKRFVLSYGRGDAHVGILALGRDDVLRGLKDARAERSLALG